MVEKESEYLREDDVGEDDAWKLKEEELKVVGKETNAIRIPLQKLRISVVVLMIKRLL